MFVLFPYLLLKHDSSTPADWQLEALHSGQEMDVEPINLAHTSSIILGK